MGLVRAAARLRDALEALPPATPFVYDPLVYAWGAHEAYLRKYGEAGPTGRVLLVGMNPGPHGMGQTGVPFGDVGWVRDWMGIEAPVAQPAKPHPKRPVSGFACTRREPSGSRLYAWAQSRFGSAATFFQHYFVVNYCPLLFYDADGGNVTPPQLGAAARAAVEAPCDAHLAEAIRAVSPRLVVGVGGFAEASARRVVQAQRLDVPVGVVLHPSPASPAANRGWAEQAERQLAALGAPLGPAPEERRA